MRTPSPVDIHRQWAKRASSGDLDGLVALYEPGAVLFTAPGQPATGTPAIREGLAPYLALQPSMTVETLDVIEVDDLALMRDRWTLKGTDAQTATPWSSPASRSRFRAASPTAAGCTSLTIPGATDERSCARR
jgi:ketosteroid isomerase-like protein